MQYENNKITIWTESKENALEFEKTNSDIFGLNEIDETGLLFTLKYLILTHT